MSKGNMNDSAIKCAETDEVNWFLWCVLSVRSCVCGEKRFAATDFHRMRVTLSPLAGIFQFISSLVAWIFFCLLVCARAAPADWMKRWATKRIFNGYQSPVVHPINIRHGIGYARYRMLGVFVAFVSVCGREHADCASIRRLLSPNKVETHQLSWVAVESYTINLNRTEHSRTEFGYFPKIFSELRSWTARGRNGFMNKKLKSE